MNNNKIQPVTLTCLGFDKISRYYKFHISGVLDGKTVSVHADYTPNHFTNFEGQGAETAKRNRGVLAAFAPSFLEDYKRDNNI